MITYRLYLSCEERSTLESWVKKPTMRARKVRDAKILLGSDENVERYSSTILELSIGVSSKTIERTRKSFCEQGMTMFEPKPRKPRSDIKVDGRVEAHLIALLSQTPPDGEDRWKLQLLADRLVELEVVESISKTMVSRVLKKKKASLFSSAIG